MWNEGRVGLRPRRKEEERMGRLDGAVLATGWYRGEESLCGVLLLCRARVGAMKTTHIPNPHLASIPTHSLTALTPHPHM